MRKVFVTGVAGFLGSHIAERFRNLGWEVAGIDNLSGGTLENIPDAIHFERRDCLQPTSYEPLVLGADLVFHCAASAYDGLSVFSPGLVYRDTVQATVEVASVAVKSEVGRFVHCSSMARYGAHKAPFSEDMVPAPISPYGLAKYASEQIVANLFERHGGEYVIAVPHSIIGPRQRFDDPYRNVAAIMINRMLRGLQPVIYGDGSNVRCFSFISDVTFCLEALGVLPAAAAEIFNIGPDEEAVTILELAERIAALLNFSLDPEFVPARPGDVGVATCNADKARRILGYTTSTSLDTGLRAMITWIDNVGPRDFVYDLPIEIVTAQTPLTWLNRLL